MGAGDGDAVILINANAVTQGPLRALDWIGFAIFAAGLTMETVADQQKRAFKADERNKGRYIDSGLWSVSRHPNYLAKDYFMDWVEYGGVVGGEIRRRRNHRVRPVAVAGDVFNHAVERDSVVREERGREVG